MPFQFVLFGRRRLRGGASNAHLARQRLVFDISAKILHHVLHVVIALVVGDDIVGDLETGCLAHGLQAVYDLARQALFGQFRRDIGIDGDTQLAVFAEGAQEVVVVDYSDLVREWQRFDVKLLQDLVLGAFQPASSRLPTAR